MADDLFEKLIAAASKDDQAELTVAHNGRVVAMRAYNQRPGRQTKEDFDAARSMFDEVLERLTEKYFPEDKQPAEGERFKNRKQAFDWLVAQGYKVSRGKFYGDCDGGFPAVHKDGTVSRYQVLQYGQQLDMERRATAPAVDYSGETEELEVRKLRAEVTEKEAKARREDERWMLRDDAWMAMAAMLGTLHDNLRHHFDRSAERLVYLAGGEHGRGPEVYGGAEEAIAAAFNDLAGGVLAGVFADEAAEGK